MNKLLSSSKSLIFNETLNITNHNSLIRCLATHWDPKFKKLRKQKFIKMKIPDFDELRSKATMNKTSEERRADFIKEGIEPPLSFEYKPFNITTSSEIFDPYVPPEGDGKASIFSKEGIKQGFSQITKKVSKSMRHNRQIKKYDETFDESMFGEYAQQIYIDAHNALMNRDSEKMLEYATEHAYGKMWVNMKFKTIRWKWIESLEEPSVKHVITREMLNASTLYGQVTVRLHSKQLLAVYDRFGRLAFGSETIPKDVIEYVVFEKHLTNIYGLWRLHDKIVPEWASTQSPVIRTFRQPKLFELDENVKEVELSKFKKDDSHIDDNESTEHPKLATN